MTETPVQTGVTAIAHDAAPAVNPAGGVTTVKTVAVIAVVIVTASVDPHADPPAVAATNITSVMPAKPRSAAAKGPMTSTRFWLTQ